MWNIHVQVPEPTVCDPLRFPRTLSESRSGQNAQGFVASIIASAFPQPTATACRKQTNCLFALCLDIEYLISNTFMNFEIPEVKAKKMKRVRLEVRVYQICWVKPLIDDDRRYCLADLPLPLSHFPESLLAQPADVR